MRHMFFVSSLLLGISASAMAGQVYKWVDAQGVTHFSAQPPADQQATSINIAVPLSPKATTDGQADTHSGDAVNTPEQTAIDKQVKTEVAEKEAKLKQYCQDARLNLAQLENNPHLKIELNGEVQRLGEDERQKRITDLRKSITENCQ